MTWLTIAGAVIGLLGFLILTWLAVWATRKPRPHVDRDPHWDCADEADRMYPEDTP